MGQKRLSDMALESPNAKCRNLNRLSFSKRNDGSIVEIGKGTFGIVVKGQYAFEGEDKDKICAIKLATKKKYEEDFVCEYDFIQNLNNAYTKSKGDTVESKKHAYFVQVYAVSYMTNTGLTGLPVEACGFVMQLLGPSIEEIFSKRSDKLYVCEEKQYRLCLLADRMLEILEFLAEQGVLHRDMKPDNWLLSSETDPKDIKDQDVSLVRLIDFGFATNQSRIIRDVEKSKLRKKALQAKKQNVSKVDAKTMKQEGLVNKESDSVKCSFVGTIRYCSLLTHMGHPPSFSGDLEAALYVLLYCYYGSLPWQNKRIEDFDKRILKDSYKKAKEDPSIDRAIKMTLPHSENVGYVKMVVGSSDIAKGTWLKREEFDRHGISPLPDEFVSLIEMSRMQRKEAFDYWKKSGKPYFEKPNYKASRELVKKCTDRLKTSLLVAKSSSKRYELIKKKK